MKKSAVFSACLLMAFVYLIGVLWTPSSLREIVFRVYDPVFQAWHEELPEPIKKTVLLRSGTPTGADAIEYWYDAKEIRRLWKTIDFQQLNADHFVQVAQAITTAQNSADTAQRTSFHRDFPYEKVTSANRDNWFYLKTDPNRPGSFYLLLLPNQGADGVVYLFSYLAS